MPSNDERPSPVTQAVLDEGYAWEEEVLRSLGKRALVGAGKGRLRERVIEWPAARTLLASGKRDVFLYQPSLSVPASFYDRFGLDPSKARFADCRPDLVHLGQDGRLLVIDVKATENARFGHRVQAGLYALILRELLETDGIRDWPVDLDRCGIWLFGHAEPEVLSLESVMPALGAFLRDELPRILSAKADEAKWSLCYLCEWCEFWQHCRSEAEHRNDVSLLPYFPTQAKAFLQGLKQRPDTIKSLAAYLSTDESRSALRDCASLAGRQDRLRSETASMIGEMSVPYGGSTFLLPRLQNVAIAITLQQDPLSGGICAAALRTRGGKDLGLPVQWQVVARDSGPEERRRVRRALVKTLAAIFTEIDRFNRETAREWKDQKSVQCYAFDSYERQLLDQLLLESLEDPDLAGRALDLFFHFQSESLAESERHPDAEVPHSVVVLTEVIRRVLALPVPVSYRLASVSECIQPSEYASVYREGPAFAFPLSNRMRIDPLYVAWRSGDKARIDDAVAAVERELERRLKATFSVLSGLQEQLSTRLFAYAPKFRLPEASRFRDPILSRLAFMVRYEQVLAYLSTRALRMESREQRLEAGTALRFRLLKQRADGTWEAALAPESRHARVETSGLAGQLLSLDSDEGDREQMRFDDFQYRHALWLPARIAVHYARVADYVPDDKGGVATLALTSGSSSPALKRDDHVLVHHRFTDWTTRPLLDALHSLDKAAEPAYTALLRRPHEFRGTRRLPAKGNLEAVVSRLGFTASQARALREVLGGRLQLIWGPPGTGKTHFLGLLVCALALLAGRRLSVLVTAFTHAAVENCLKRIQELVRAPGSGLQESEVCKLRSWKGTDQPEAIRVVETDPRAGSKAPLVVVGGTVFGIARCIDSPFDLVVIDEGSQLRVPEAAVPASLVGPEGRLVVAGDDRQLGPIVHGTYPEPTEGEPGLFQSIFHCLRKPDEGRDEYTSRLTECFRLNSTLCRFPAEVLYGTEYRPLDDAVGQQAIRLRSTEGLEPWLSCTLDPEYPLAMLVLRGFRALAENPEEARLSASIALALRERLLAENGEPYSTDADFWGRGLFMVSPHHVQIAAIRDRLLAARRWSAAPYIDTVEKMQGRESDCVVVSYGVADPEYALLEGEFIYSLNRLNVAMTRARSKAIMFLSEPLLTPPALAFSRDELLEGLMFMRDLREFILKHGELHRFDMGQGHELLVHRARWRDGR